MAKVRHSLVVILALLLISYPIYIFVCWFMAGKYYNEGMRYYKQRNWTYAKQFLAKAANYNYACPHTHYFLGNVFRESHDFNGALMAYQHVEKLSPNCGRLHFEIGELHIKGFIRYKNWRFLDLALAEFIKQHQLDPIDPDVKLRIQEIFKARRMYAERKG